MSQKRLNQDFSKNVEKINSRLLTLTYGSLIVRLIKDYEKPEEINEQLAVVDLHPAVCGHHCELPGPPGTVPNL